MDYLAVLARRLLALMERTASPDESELQLMYGCEEDETAPAADPLAAEPSDRGRSG
jgi:hypothetical protein